MGYRRFIQFFLAVVVLALISVLFKYADQYTSSNSYCNSCHVHDHAYESWLESNHHSNCEGVVVNCVECHLPPKGQGFYAEKIKRGAHDLYAFYFKDSTEYNWHQKSLVDQAKHHTFEASCIKCHPNLFPVDLSENGEMAHWHYHQHREELHCVQCHMNVGHGSDQKMKQNWALLKAPKSNDTIYQQTARITGFNNFKETVPNSNISFNMIAVPGGEAVLGNGHDTCRVRLSAFFIGEIEVSWNEYLLFLRETESEGRSDQTLDGISGATPPWGNPDQGWGMADRPAITMTHHAAQVYCQWLSVRTGKQYRLPTEAEWEYAAQKAYDGIKHEEGFVSNERASTVSPEVVQADALGLKNMFGNVKEFCSDSYTISGYQCTDSILINPIIKSVGKEYVLKGGSFKTAPEHYKAHYREATQHDNWMKTDPQIPKSIWWYSDCNDVGFRVVLSYQEPGKIVNHE